MSQAAVPAGNGRQHRIARAAGTPGGAAAWRVAAILVAALVAMPVLALAAIAAQGSGDLWPHLARYVMPQAFLDTALLLLGVGIIVIVVGTGTAWLVTAFDFPGRRALDWLLLLPLAIPTYIIAFAYLDMLHPLGPVQGAIRAMLGLSSPRDLRLPDIRSTLGCILVLGLVLYPYVYLSVRALFLMQSACLIDVSRTLGQGRTGAFWRVALPMARPAVAIGASLALMEALNDVGAAEFLGVRTLTVSVYSTWINRSSLAGAAQIALLMLAVVTAMVAIERHARRRQAYAASAQRARRLAPHRLSGWRAGGAALACFLPVLFGFGLPALHLAVVAARRLGSTGWPPGLGPALLTTLSLSLVATIVIVVLAGMTAYAHRGTTTGFAALPARVASVGYAVPGTVLAIGLLTPLAMVDNALNALTQATLGLTPGLILSGTGIALVYAYAARFLAIGIGGIEAGFQRIPASLDHAARALGESRAGVARHIHMPLLRPALVSAALLVFVDCMKELPATLLLRPLNVETLATQVYAQASRGTYEDGALAALLIVAAGLVPVVLLSRVSRGEPEPVLAAALPDPVRT